ncbi:MAG: hypothetical protein KF882_08555 [Bacteroidia bacterium]|nr:hypothetical protein [Bacteroidia bacterium]
MKNLLNLICLGALTILLSTSMISKTLMQNIPKDHETAGVLYPPIDVPDPINSPIWNIVNNTDCNISINIWLSFFGGSIPQGYTIIVPPRSSQIISASSFSLPPGTNTITKASANVGVELENGLFQNQEIYPNNTKIYYDTKCGCVEVSFNGNTITINPC